MYNTIRPHQALAYLTPQQFLERYQQNQRKEAVCHQSYEPVQPLDPSVLSHDFARIVGQAGLGRVRIHDLRHTFASLALLRGAKPKVISEALRHRSVAFTMDTYSHIISGMQEDAMALVDEALPGGVCKK